MSDPSKDIQDDIIDEFGLFMNWADRYQYIIDLGKSLPEYPEAFKDEQHIVKGCQSQVWLYADKQVDGSFSLFCTSDSAIVRGLIALVLRVYNHRTAAEIKAIKPDFIQAIGLDQHLSPTRRNGMGALLNYINALA